MADTKKKNKQRVFATDEEVLAIRNSSNRVRAAKVLVEREKYAKGRPHNMMPRRTAGKVFKELLRYFFIPLVNAMDLGDDPSDKMGFAERIAFIFGAAHRDVVLAVATQEFKMPGLMWHEENPGEMITCGPVESRILVGTTLMVRLDERMPDRIDVERCDEKHGTVFTLTKPQYETIYKYLREVAGCNERLMPPGTFVVR